LIRRKSRGLTSFLPSTANRQLSTSPAGLYIHFPFCLRFCPYCDFYKERFDDKRLRACIERFKGELGVYRGKEIETVYLGGGSPSLLGKEGGGFFRFIRKNFPLRAPEITLEVNPEDASEDRIMLWKEWGINRISLGLQTADKRRLEEFGRGYSGRAARRVFEELRSAGFKNISIDLIFGFPYTNMALLKKDLEYTLSLQPEHISVYNLSWKNPEMRKWRKGKLTEDTESGMYNLVCEILGKAGYDHYEISSFAKKGFYSRHNLKYWRLEEWIGAGPGAAGYTGGIWYKNREGAEDYIKKGPVRAESRELDEKDRVMMGLRTKWGIKRSGPWEEKLGKWRECFRWRRDRISFKEEKWFVSDYILAKII